MLLVITLQQRRPVPGNLALLKCLLKRRGSENSSELSLWWENNTLGNIRLVSSLLFLFGFVLYMVVIHLFSALYGSGSFVTCCR